MFKKSIDSRKCEPDAYVIDRGTIRYVQGRNQHDFNAEMQVGEPHFIIYIEDNPAWIDGRKISTLEYAEIRLQTESALKNRGVIIEWEYLQRRPT